MSKSGTGFPRVDDYSEFGRLASAWEDNRNEWAHTVERWFTVDDARHKLNRLYPKIELEESENCT